MIIVRMTTMKVKRRFSLINILNCKVIITRIMIMMLRMVMMKESIEHLQGNVLVGLEDDGEVDH